MIRKFEMELGGDLFVRHYHDLELTPLGRRLLPEAVNVLEAASEMERTVHGRPRVLRIGSTPWVPTRFTERFEQTARGLGGPVSVVSDVSSALLHALRHGDLDAALVNMPVTFEGISTRTLASYEWSVLTDPSSVFAGRPSLTLNDLAGVPILSVAVTAQPATTESVNARLAEAGLTDVSVLDMQDWIKVPQILRSGGGVMFGGSSPDSVFAGFVASGQLISIPLADGELEISLGAAWPTRSNDPQLLKLIAGIDALSTSAGGAAD